jgi:hypothetical protein
MRISPGQITKSRIAESKYIHIFSNWTKDLNRHFIKENIINKQMERYLISLVIAEI